MIELWNAAVSTCSQKVRMVLAEKKLDWVDHQINFTRGDHLSDAYLAMNPNGVVPTLVHDGTPITDSSAINEYLDEAFPDNPLRPADLKRRAAMRAWRQYIDEVPTPAIRVPSFHLVFRRIWAGLSAEEFDRHAERLPLRKHFYKQMRSGGFSDEEMNAAMEKLRQTVERMEKALGSGPWLIGDQFTLADVSVMPTIVRLEDLGLSSVWSDLPGVQGWYRRLQERPAFAKAYYEGSRGLTPAC
jgi:glutathione S-transferase